MLRLAAALAVVAAIPASPAAAAPAGARCRALRATPALRATLLRVHTAKLPAQTTARGPVGRVYYGRCGRTSYALASFEHRTADADLGTQDQPERFRRAAGRRWTDLGDTGGVVCGAAPRALLRRWRLAADC